MVYMDCYRILKYSMHRKHASLKIELHASIHLCIYAFMHACALACTRESMRHTCRHVRYRACTHSLHRMHCDHCVHCSMHRKHAAPEPNPSNPQGGGRHTNPIHRGGGGAPKPMDRGDTSQTWDIYVCTRSDCRPKMEFDECDQNCSLYLIRHYSAPCCTVQHTLEHCRKLMVLYYAMQGSIMCHIVLYNDIQFHIAYSLHYITLY